MRTYFHFQAEAADLADRCKVHHEVLALSQTKGERFMPSSSTPVLSTTVSSTPVSSTVISSTQRFHFYSGSMSYPTQIQCAI